jgi:periplasmic divalent cation tolerance protein
MSNILVYITAGSLEEAKSIAKTLVEKRLVACANIIPQIESVYWWKGKMCEENEVAIFAKTSKERTGQVISETKKLHSYSVPCIITMDITDGNPEYLNWIKTEIHSV